MLGYLSSKVRNQEIRLGEWFDYIKYHTKLKFNIKTFNKSVFKGKSIAVVGPADSIKDEEHGNYIDTFDIVIRINKGVDYIESIPQYVGTKTDYIFHGGTQQKCGKLKPHFWKSCKVGNYVYSEYHKSPQTQIRIINELYRDLLHEYPLQQIDQDEYQNLMRLVKGHYPNSGFVALYSAITSEASKIFITGFTFYKSPYADPEYSVHQTKDILAEMESSGYHNPTADYELFKSLLKQNKHRIQVDSRLKLILENDGVFLDAENN